MTVKEQKKKTQHKLLNQITVLREKILILPDSEDKQSLLLLLDEISKTCHSQSDALRFADILCWPNLTLEIYFTKKVVVEPLLRNKDDIVTNKLYTQITGWNQSSFLPTL